MGDWSRHALGVGAVVVRIVPGTTLPLTLALISASTSSQLAAATVVILMPHATPKGTGVEGQAPSKEEPNPLKAFDIWKPWKAVPPATPSASMVYRVRTYHCELPRRFV